MIQEKVMEHYQESLKYFSKDNILGIFLQGSQNYRLDLPTSDIDTKLIIVPSLESVAMNKLPISTTYVRENEEHIDWKDIRLYIKTFYKQNLNFMEILFTPYFYINPLYSEAWNELFENREKIARMNPYRAIKSMKGIALEKFHALKHPYPSKINILNRFGYDPKQLHHLIRVDNFITRYLNGEPYANCLIPEENVREFLLKVKRGEYSLEDAEYLAEITLNHAVKTSDEFCENKKDEENAEMRKLLEKTCYNILKIAIQKELADEALASRLD